uniref:Error-prone DNA polymerase n=1 Tax=Anthurium amnicola TaxID=1678845 RepID=A0A1D1XHY6_9ARAE
MANPRRSSGLHFQNLAADQNPQPPQPSPSSPLSSLVVFLKRPHAFPFLLSVFILLTWVSLRFQHPHSPHRTNPSPFADSSSSSRVQSRARESTDVEANLVRFSSREFPSQFLRDKRGWLLNPVNAALEAGLSGGAKSCASVHVGEIRPGGVRGNHRHHTCNETLIFWGSMTKFRLENPSGEKEYAEATIGVDEVAIAASPSGMAHALVNMDPVRATFFLGCQDDLINYNSSTTDFNVWKDL